MPIAFTVQQTGAPSSDLGAQIRSQVQQQVRQQIDAARQQAQAARDQARAAQEQAMRQAQASTQGTPIVVQTPFPPFQRPVIPHEAVTISIAFFVMVAVIIIGLPIARAVSRYFDRRASSPALNPEITAQLQRIEQAVDTMAIEVERISEAQRYMVRLETERRAEPAVLRPGKE